MILYNGEQLPIADVLDCFPIHDALNIRVRHICVAALVPSFLDRAENERHVPTEENVDCVSLSDVPRPQA